MISENPWQSEELPGGWKRRITVPIIKKGRKENPEDFPSVSLTSLPGKTMEQILLGAVFRDMEDREETGDSHHSFSERKSCLTKLVGQFCDRLTT